MAFYYSVIVPHFSHSYIFPTAYSQVTQAAQILFNYSERKQRPHQPELNQTLTDTS